MGEQESGRGTGPEGPPDARVEVGPGTRGTRRRAVAIVAGVVAMLMLAGVVVAVLEDGSEPGLAKLPLLGDNAARTEQVASADAAMLPARTIRFELEGDLPELAATGPVSRFRLPVLDEQAARNLALALGVDEPAAVRREGEGLVVAGSQRELSAYPSGGAWSVGVNPRIASVPESSPPSAGPGGGSASLRTIDGPATVRPPANLPSEAGAERIARERLGTAGVIDAGWTVQVLDSGGVSISVACAVGEACPEPAPAVLTARSVVFTKVVGDTGVDGLTWSVEVGDEGVISGISGTLTELEPLGDYPVRTTRAAFAALTENPYGDSPVHLGAAESGSAIDLGAADTPAAAPGTDVESDPGSGPDAPVESPPIGDEPSLDEPETVVVTITGVERATMLTVGRVDGEDVMFVVPGYRFVGRYADGSGFETLVNALEPSSIQPPRP